MSVPQHSATAPITFILPGDRAWDRDRYDAECLVDNGSGPTIRAGHEDHPILRYIRGETRYDLDAPGPVDDQIRTPRDYLHPESAPCIWYLRRLRITELARCRDAGGLRSQMEAFRIGVLSVENAPGGYQHGDSPLSEQRLDDAADALGAKIIFDVGEAVMRASEAPTSAEKKP